MIAAAAAAASCSLQHLGCGGRAASFSTKTADWSDHEKKISIKAFFLSFFGV